MVRNASDNLVDSDVMVFVPSLGMEIKIVIDDIGSYFVIFLHRNQVYQSLLQ